MVFSILTKNKRICFVCFFAFHSKQNKFVRSFFGRIYGASICFWFYLTFKNINLGDRFLLKTFFLDSIFEPPYFLKLCPIFDELSFLVGFSFFFPWTKILLFRTHHLWNSTTELRKMNQRDRSRKKVDSSGARYLVAA